MLERVQSEFNGDCEKVRETNEKLTILKKEIQSLS